MWFDPDQGEDEEQEALQIDIWNYWTSINDKKTKKPDFEDKNP